MENGWVPLVVLGKCPIDVIIGTVSTEQICSFEENQRFEICYLYLQITKFTLTYLISMSHEYEDSPYEQECLITGEIDGSPIPTLIPLSEQFYDELMSDDWPFGLMQSVLLLFRKADIEKACMDVLDVYIPCFSFTEEQLSALETDEEGAWKQMEKDHILFWNEHLERIEKDPFVPNHKEHIILCVNSEYGHSYSMQIKQELRGEGSCLLAKVFEPDNISGGISSRDIAEYEFVARLAAVKLKYKKASEVGSVSYTKTKKQFPFVPGGGFVMLAYAKDTLKKIGTGSEKACGAISILEMFFLMFPSFRKYRPLVKKKAKFPLLALSVIRCFLRDIVDRVTGYSGFTLVQRYHWWKLLGEDFRIEVNGNSSLGEEIVNVVRRREKPALLKELDDLFTDYKENNLIDWSYDDVTEKQIAQDEACSTLYTQVNIKSIEKGTRVIMIGH